jgi:predicted RNA-binding Zn-ribbon protein involved in translation (DUF1610 family)
MTNVATAKARCVSCREEIQVPDHYAHGDHVKCGSCGTNHKVVRGDHLHLVLADVGPLRDALAQNEQVASRLEAELANVRGSFGIGANGIWFGAIVAIYQVAFRGEPLSMNLLWNAVGIALVTGLLLEAANWAFLAKRHALTRLTAELEEARSEGARLRQLIRESSRI